MKYNMGDVCILLLAEEDYDIPEEYHEQICTITGINNVFLEYDIIMEGGEAWICKESMLKFFAPTMLQQIQQTLENLK